MFTENDIIQEGDSTLSKVADVVPIPLEIEDIEIMDGMLDLITRKKLKGIKPAGLAAPQLNISKRIIAVKIRKRNKTKYPIVLANPKIITYKKGIFNFKRKESCLSIPNNKKPKVRRYKKITIIGYNNKSEEIKLELSGFNSVIFQHEIDHLDGILCTERAKNEYCLFLKY